MYARRIQLVNYGPIASLDIEFPFNDGEIPKPVILVGENGSGKSILLSHVVNGLLSAKEAGFPETPEVAPRQVYKLRSDAYIRAGCHYYFARVDFDGDLFFVELRSRQNKASYASTPAGISGTSAEAVWQQMDTTEKDHFESSRVHNADSGRQRREAFDRNCVLYFPFNRFEEPAWLNSANLVAEAQHMDLPHIAGATKRRVVASSPLEENQDWLFGIAYDLSVFRLPDAEGAYRAVQQVMQTITRNRDARFAIGPRRNRTVSITSASGELIPNIFQLSSGETSLLNLFLSVLRDFDLSGTVFSGPHDVRGIVLVDEIDLHLHAVHQHEVLPQLMRMFPKVQFIVTTHSPLFVLGMQKIFGDEGFALYRLPQGDQISPEEFSEFGEAYVAFSGTRKFSADVRSAIEGAQKPIVFVEGSTGVEYVRRAAELLGRSELLDRTDLRDGGGGADLGKIWNACGSMPPGVVAHQVILLPDCDSRSPDSAKGKCVRRAIPERIAAPIRKGIENLFGRHAIQKAIEHKAAFIDVVAEHCETVRGECMTVPEAWAVNDDEKTNLCHWLCENGTAEDFEGFGVIFDLLEEVLVPSTTGTVES